MSETHFSRTLDARRKASTSHYAYERGHVGIGPWEFDKLCMKKRCKLCGLYFGFTDMDIYRMASEQGLEVLKHIVIFSTNSKRVAVNEITICEKAKPLSVLSKAKKYEISDEDRRLWTAFIQKKLDLLNEHKAKPKPVKLAKAPPVNMKSKEIRNHIQGVLEQRRKRTYKPKHVPDYMIERLKALESPKSDSASYVPAKPLSS